MLLNGFNHYTNSNSYHEDLTRLGFQKVGSHTTGPVYKSEDGIEFWICQSSPIDWLILVAEQQLSLPPDTALPLVMDAEHRVQLVLHWFPAFLSYWGMVPSGLEIP